MTSKILLPYDGTEISDKALYKAKEFAKAFNAELYILHVIEHIAIKLQERTFLTIECTKDDGLCHLQV